MTCDGTLRGEAAQKHQPIRSWSGLTWKSLSFSSVPFLTAQPLVKLGLLYPAGATSPLEVSPLSWQTSPFPLEHLHWRSCQHLPKTAFDTCKPSKPTSSPVGTNHEMDEFKTLSLPFGDPILNPSPHDPQLLTVPSFAPVFKPSAAQTTGSKPLASSYSLPRPARHGGCSTSRNPLQTNQARFRRTSVPGVGRHRAEKQSFGAAFDIESV